MLLEQALYGPLLEISHSIINTQIFSLSGKGTTFPLRYGFLVQHVTCTTTMAAMGPQSHKPSLPIIPFLLA